MALPLEPWPHGPDTEDCKDDENFVDAHGYRCYEWVGYAPCLESIISYGWAAAEGRAVEDRCPRACARCKLKVPLISEERRALEGLVSLGFIGNTSGGGDPRPLWNLSADPCTSSSDDGGGWPGVSCDPSDTGRVIGLNLVPASIPGINGRLDRILRAVHGFELSALVAGNTPLLSGTLPADIDQLLGGNRSLTTLELHNFSLSGTMPPAITRLTRLTYCAAYFQARLSGRIPPDLALLTGADVIDFDDVPKLSGRVPELPVNSLRVLFLGGSEDEPSRLSGTISNAISGSGLLETVHLLQMPEISGTLPRELHLLAQLSRLRITNSRISGTLVNSFKTMSNLELLEISDDQDRMSGTLSREFASKLKTLELDIARLSGTLPDLNLTISGSGPDGGAALEHLAMKGSASLSGTLPCSWSGFDKLQSLQLERNNGVEGTLCVSFGSWQTLQTLSFKNMNGLSGTIPPESLRNMDRLVQFELSKLDKVSGRVPDYIDELVNLQYFELRELPRLSGTVPVVNNRRLAKHGSNISYPLRSLSLIDLPHLSGRLPPELFRWSNLNDLNVALLGDEATGKVSGSFPEELSRLSELRSLRVQGMRLSGTLPAAWGGWDRRPFPPAWASHATELFKETLRYNTDRRYCARSDFAKLNSLNLRGNALSERAGAALGTLATLPGLVELDLSNNKLFGSVLQQDTLAMCMAHLDPSLGGPLPRLVSVFQVLSIMKLNGNQIELVPGMEEKKKFASAFGADNLNILLLNSNNLKQLGFYRTAAGPLTVNVSDNPEMVGFDLPFWAEVNLNTWSSVASRPHLACAGMAPSADFETSGGPFAGVTKTWHVDPEFDGFQRCVCERGFERIERRNGSASPRCEPCPANTFMALHGADRFGVSSVRVRDMRNDRCTPCPDNSETDGTGATSSSQCECLTGYTRYGDCSNYCVKVDRAFSSVLNYSPVSCSERSNNGTESTATIMLVQRGFWRANRSATEVYECPDSAACLGETATFNSSGPENIAASNGCAPYSSGPVCAACVPSTFQSEPGRCQPCPDPGETIGALVGILAGIVVFLALFAAAYRVAKRRWVQQKQRHWSREQEALHINRFKAGWKSGFILLGYFQVISQYPLVLKVLWPTEVQSTLQAFDVVNLNIFDVSALRCLTSVNYLGEMVTSISFGFALIILVVAQAVAALWLPRRANAEAAPDDRRRRRVDRLWRRPAFKWPMRILYISHTSVSTKTLRLYACSPFASTSYLTADVRVVCSSREWEQVAYGWGIAACAVILVGFPLFLVLIGFAEHAATSHGGRDKRGSSAARRRARRPSRWHPKLHEYEQRKGTGAANARATSKEDATATTTTTAAASTSTAADAAATTTTALRGGGGAALHEHPVHFGSLYRSSMFWYAGLDKIRKVLSTSAPLLLADRDQVSQLVFACAVNILFFAATAALDPFKENVHRRLANTCQFSLVLVLVLLIGAVISPSAADLAASAWSTAVIIVMFVPPVCAAMLLFASSEVQLARRVVYRRVTTGSFGSLGEFIARSSVASIAPEEDVGPAAERDNAAGRGGGRGGAVAGRDDAELALSPLSMPREELAAGKLGRPLELTSNPYVRRRTGAVARGEKVAEVFV